MTTESIDTGVVLVSGGLDSLAALCVALKECDDVVALHASYGQRTAEREKRAFEEICDHYQIAHRHIIDMNYLAIFGGSSLTSTVEEIQPSLLAGGAPSTYVPFRNANLLSAAVSWAEALGADAVYIGAVEEDSPDYPDCRRNFIYAFQRAVEEGTRPGTGIMIRVPVISLNKDQIVRLVEGFEAPIELTWSCYMNDGDIACGACDSCLLRLRAFHKAGKEDPLKYEAISKKSRKFIES